MNITNDLLNSKACNLNLQLALQEKNKDVSIFSNVSNENLLALIQTPFTQFKPGEFNIPNMCPTCCSGASSPTSGSPRDVRTVPCDVLLSGYRPLDAAYCCPPRIASNVCCPYNTPTDLELRAAALNKTAPFLDRALTCSCRKDDLFKLQGLLW